MEGAMRTSAFEASGEKKMGGKETRKIESLGWITESSVMPRKRRDIDGVGVASILGLQAELYRTQEDVKKIKEGGDLDPQRARKKLGIPDVFSKKNSGVEERAGRDKLHLKTENDGSASYAALEKKAELYDKLVRGEVPDGDEEKYNVLFYKKGTLETEFEALESERRGETPNPNSGFQDTSTAASSERHGLGNNTIRLSQEQKQLIKEVNQETIQERQKASTLKQKREEVAAKKREQLRNAYIKKKLEEMKAASRKATLEPTGDGAHLADPNPQLESADAA